MMSTAVLKMHTTCRDLRWVPEQVRRRYDDPVLVRPTSAQRDERTDVLRAEARAPARLLVSNLAHFLLVVRNHLLADALERVLAVRDEAAVLLPRTSRIHPGVVGFLELREEFLCPVDFLLRRASDLRRRSRFAEWTRGGG